MGGLVQYSRVLMRFMSCTAYYGISIITQKKVKRSHVLSLTLLIVVPVNV